MCVDSYMQFRVNLYVMLSSGLESLWPFLHLLLLTRSIFPVHLWLQWHPCWTFPGVLFGSFPLWYTLHVPLLCAPAWVSSTDRLLIHWFLSVLFFFKVGFFNYSIKFLVSVIVFLNFGCFHFILKKYFPVLCVVPQSVTYFLQHNKN